jgi:Zn-dependent membrane protease YugP
MAGLLWLLLLVPVLAGFWAQRRVQAVVGRYRRVPNRLGVSGAELARGLLDAHGLQRVRLELAPGALSDHYDGAAGALRLSAGIARERSVASLAIAAHEVSHAYQDAEGSRFYRFRRTVGEPLARVAPWSGFLFVGGFLFRIPALMILAILYVAGLLVFALATLPVELGASRRAIRLLRGARLADEEEAGEVERVLRAAALTYLAGLLRQLGLFLVLVALAEAAGGVAR